MLLNPFSYMKETFNDAIYNNSHDDVDDTVEDASIASSTCPSCGAPVTDAYADNCPYCNCVYPWRI